MISSQLYYDYEENDLHQALEIVGAMIDRQSRYYPHCTRSQISKKSTESDGRGKTSSTTDASLGSSRKPIYSLSPSTVAIKDEDCESPSSSPVQNNGTKLSLQIRTEVCQWMYKVIDHYSFDRTIVAIAMNYFTRFFMATSNELEKSSYELVTATSLYLAIKIHGPKLSASDDLINSFVQMSNNRFKGNDLRQMEMKMLTKFSWFIHPSTPQHFIYNFINILNYFDENLDDDSYKFQLIELSIYIIELIIFDQQLNEKDSPSSLACAAILIALNSIQTTNAARAKDFTCNSSGDTAIYANNSLCPARNPIDCLQPLFSHGLVDQSTIFNIANEMGCYLKKVSPGFKNVQLDIDPSKILFKHLDTANYVR